MKFFLTWNQFSLNILEYLPYLFVIRRPDILLIGRGLFEQVNKFICTGQRTTM